MSKICYISKRFKADSQAVIDTANDIIEEYQADGYDLTLRQLYYQFVARDMLPNTERSYKNLSALISNARLAGLVDWDAITDRTRFVRSNSHWKTPSSVIRSAARSYQIDKWERQEYRVEVWIEKDALIGVIESVCNSLDVPFFSCRGYVSQSEMWSAGQRLLGYCFDGHKPIILHLGDHDPSGIDMTRDIQDRLSMFAQDDNGDSYDVEVKRIALNRNQIDLYDPPPNPAKITDPRAKDYIERYGDTSWELDALDPRTMSELIEEHVLEYRDEDLWNMHIESEKKDKWLLNKAVSQWSEVAGMLLKDTDYDDEKE